MGVSMISFKRLLIASLLLACATLDINASPKHAHTPKRHRNAQRWFLPNPMMYKRFPLLCKRLRGEDGRFMRNDQKQIIAQREAKDASQECSQLEQQIARLKLYINQLYIPVTRAKFLRIVKFAQLDEQSTQELIDSEQQYSQPHLQLYLFKNLQLTQFNQKFNQTEQETAEFLQKAYHRINEISKTLRQTGDQQLYTQQKTTLDNDFTLLDDNHQNQLEQLTTTLEQEFNQFDEYCATQIDTQGFIDRMEDAEEPATQIDTQEEADSI
jgi:hypothetical protein